nr:hypothetical protein CFP56_37228 [Quercus suber]
MAKKIVRGKAAGRETSMSSSSRLETQRSEFLLPSYPARTSLVLSSSSRVGDSAHTWTRQSGDSDGEISAELRVRSSGKEVGGQSTKHLRFVHHSGRSGCSSSRRYAQIEPSMRMRISKFNQIFPLVHAIEHLPFTLLPFAPSQALHFQVSRKIKLVTKRAPASAEPCCRIL